jgi:hypothetical protein
LETRISPRLRPILGLLAASIRQCHNGDLAPPRAQAMASLAVALIKLTEFAEIMVRLDALESKMKGMSR